MRGEVFTKIGACVVLTCLAAAVGVSAQETVNFASVSGRVTDPSGGVVSGAQVAARQTDTNVTATAITDSEGRFRFPYLRVGSYEITVHDAGFADTTRRLTLTLGSAFDLPIVLAVPTVEATVDVVAPLPLLDAARSQIAGTVSRAEIETLPMNGRNFLDVALLVPGVSQPNVGGTQLFAETSAVPGVGVSVGSQRNFSNNFIVDGLSANDDAAGLSGIPYGVDAVDQFQVVTSGGQAELGRALGGYINVVTKSGGNATHGDFYDYVRNDRFNSPNPLSGTTLPMSQSQYGASLGGPVRRDRTFFFANFEQRLLDQSGLVTILPQSVSAINARLAAVGYPGSPVATGEYPNPVDTVNFLGKIDHQLGSRDLFSVRYSQYNVSSSNSRGAGGLSAPSASAGLDNLDQTLAFGNTTTISGRTVNELRAQVAFSDLRALPSDPIGPAVSISGIASFGTLSTSPTGRSNTMAQIVDNVSHQRGAHALRAGIDFLFNKDTITFPRADRGSYAFSSLQNFLLGVYNNAGFTQTFAETVVSQTNPNVGVYVQDEWKVGSQLTLNAGLRYDLQFLESIDTDRNNLSPRLGFAWSPGDSRRTVIRGSAGLFYDRVPLRALANALLSAGNTTDLAELRQTSISLSPAQAAAPPFPNILSEVVPSVTLFNLTTMDRGMQNAYSEQASVELEQADWRARDGQRRLPVPSRPRSHYLGQPERADVRGRRRKQRLPPEPGVREQQPVLAARALELSRRAPVVRTAAGIVGHLPRQLHALEIHGRCGPELLQLADRPVRHLEGLGPIRRRPAPSRCRVRVGPFADSPGRHDVGTHQPRLPGEQRRARVLCAAAEYHIRRDDHRGHSRTACRRRRVHRAQHRHGPRLLQPEPEGQPRVRPGPRCETRGPCRGVQPHESRQRRDGELEFRIGRVPDGPSADLRPGHGGGRSAIVPVGCARPVLRSA